MARLVEESNSGSNSGFRNRRSHERHKLTDARGQLLYRCERFPCQVVEISAGGCRLKMERLFRHGALAPVEVVLPLLGMVLHIGGVTQWTKKESQLGIRFTHVSDKSKYQVEALVACLAGKRTAESIKGSITSAKLNQNSGDVLIVQPVVVKPECRVRPSYDKEVHCGEGLVRTPRPGEWQVVCRSPDNRFHLGGDIADLSVRGCTVQTDKEFAGELNDPLELEFELRALHFSTSGVAISVYDPQTIGIQFTSMNARKRAELAEVIGEVCAANRTRLQVE